MYPAFFWIILMTDIRFYHLTKTALENALPQMLEKVIERGQEAVILSSDERALGDLDQNLWGYRPDSFLPHGTKRDGSIEEHPVWLTTEQDDIAKRDVAFIVHGAHPGALESDKTSLCAVLFDGNNPTVVQDSRALWKELKAANHELTYWQQTDRGSWEKKA